MTRRVRSTSAPRTRNLAKSLRRRMTPMEARLWLQLKAMNKEGTNFRRQVPIGPFAADFACLTSRLVIEVDGWGHWQEQGRRRDSDRDTALNEQGFRIVRFDNDDVRRELDGVVRQLRTLVIEGTSIEFNSDRTTRSSSPAVGGGVREADGGGLRRFQLHSSPIA